MKLAASLHCSVTPRMPGAALPGHVGVGGGDGDGDMTAVADSGCGGEGDATTAATRRRCSDFTSVVAGSAGPGWPWLVRMNA